MLSVPVLRKIAVTEFVSDIFRNLSLEREASTGRKRTNTQEQRPL
jgi:hypothetical protein